MRRHIPALTSLRFLAALWVFLFHLHIWHGDFGVSPVDKFLHSGAVGMAFFFVQGLDLLIDPRQVHLVDLAA